MLVSSLRRSVALGLGALVLAVIAVLASGCLQPATKPGSPAGPPNESVLSGNEPFRSDYTVGELARLSETAAARANALFAEIAALPPGGRSIESTLLRFEKTVTDYRNTVQPLALLGDVYPDPAIAAEGIACLEAKGAFLTSTYSRRDLYDAVRGAVPRTPDEERLLAVTVRAFEKNGLSLPDEQLARVKALKDDLNRLEVRFQANLNNDCTTLEFSSEDLDGLSASMIASFPETPNRTRVVSTRYPDYAAVMMGATRGETRKAMYLAYNNRQAEENTRLLEEAIGLRQEIARELGYGTWADYRIEGRMAGTTSTVMAFLSSLQAPLLEKSRAHTRELLEVKRSLDPGAVHVDPWDILFLVEQTKRKQYSYDEEQVRTYFPMDRVLEGLFRVTGSLFGVRFEEAKGAPAWSLDVRLFLVKNESDGAPIGRLYLDPYPREGKYGHFAADNVVLGHDRDGACVMPVAVIVANFRAPENGRPSLLAPDEIETLFHETGHALHMLLSRAPYATLSGAECEWDFVETPSQALEEWVWDPEILVSISGHYENLSEPIPVDLVERVVASRSIDLTPTYARLLANSLEDMRYHTATGAVDVTEVSHRTYDEVTGIAPHPETHQPATFGHMMGGYDAGYYGYLWSKVYALEIVEEFRRTGMTDRATGMRLRHAVLERGNMADGGLLLLEFLGRAPGVEGLFEQIGIDPVPEGPASPGSLRPTR